MRFSRWLARRESDLEVEIQCHLEMAVRDRKERGESLRLGPGASEPREKIGVIAGLASESACPTLQVYVGQALSPANRFFHGF